MGSKGLTYMLTTKSLPCRVLEGTMIDTNNHVNICSHINSFALQTFLAAKHTSTCISEISSLQGIFLFFHLLSK